MEATISNEKIAKTNDQVRRALPFPPLPHLFILSYNVKHYQEKDQDGFFELVSKVKSFDDFNEDNDPYQEHDMGRIKHCDKEYFFKIDYYNEDLNAFEENGRRVLTLMETSEY
jgi:hypothetical protein